MHSKEDFLKEIAHKNPGENEFLQAVKEFVDSIWDVYSDNPFLVKNRILHRITEPERIVIFKVTWIDDYGEIQTNRGYRVEFNSALGPYKGGLRFHPSVNLSGLKFLGFEQTFKNSLTTLPMGGAKGGSDFNPKGKSDAEIMRFCRSFMSELFRHIGPETDVPAGDIGVGGREIGYLFGQYKKLTREFTGALTGKGHNWGGSLIRPEATGFGSIYFLEEILKTHNDTLLGKKVSLSGFGNVAWGAALKAIQLGAQVITLSGPDGYVHIPQGLNLDMIEYMLILRASNQDMILPLAEKFELEYFPAGKPWEIKTDIAIPCAIQNELNREDCEHLIRNQCTYIIEASNMGCTLEAAMLANKKIVYAPGKAVNAGGVAVSGLEMTQNSMKLQWTAEEVDERLKIIMKSIHEACVNHGKRENGKIDYVKGANIAGFIKVATAMIEQGI